MDLLKAAHPRHAALLIRSLSGRRRIKLRVWARPLQEGTILRRTATLEAVHGLAIHLPIAFQTDQHAVAQCLTGPQHFRRSIPAIGDHDDAPCAKKRLESSKLVNCHSRRRLRAADALDSQRGNPTARLFGQQPHHREHPTNADGFVSQRQVRDVAVATIFASVRFRAFLWGGSDRESYQSIGWHLWQGP
jgi:hypothetical protein